GLNQGDINNKDLKLNLQLIGNFNIYNALAAICVGISQGIDLGTCELALEKIKGIPGRMEEVISEPFKVFVDYAFTPNALEKVYQTFQSWTSDVQNRMICVLGACGGGRDKWKRSALGELAAKYCDEIIVTNEDPYDEEPEEIIEQVAEGTKGKAKKILDRREAISQALKIAQTGDIVVITGKGCEPWICVAKGKKIPWDDREIVREEFKKLSR
ncbi:MAG: cyanophycin synthetase, partial [bacterium]|nr:cyanophycin synthetase [bacterium]